jgi:heme O synthase-like polyprenyltransferase
LDAAQQRYFRTLLVLARASNLPTVWSNCLAGWWLGGGGSVGKLLIVCFAGSAIYIGGMYLNDAFDVEFDRQHRPERPIPSGQISERQVWSHGLGWLLAGMVILFFFGATTTVLTLLLAGSVLLYDAVHKAVAFSPVLMSFCRFFLFLVAASTARFGVTGLAIWSAAALACYIIGLSYVARSESTRGAIAYWPCLLLAAPFFLAALVNRAAYTRPAFVFGAILAWWVGRHLRYIFVPGLRNVGRAVSALLAGIVLVDLLAVVVPVWAPIFCLLFVGALLFQRYIPAT